jgi:DNA-binding transcriptional regulator YiaG
MPRVKLTPEQIAHREAFSSELKQFREDNGLSREGLAEQIGSSEATIKRWEEGFGFPGQRAFDALRERVDADSASQAPRLVSPASRSE